MSTKEKGADEASEGEVIPGNGWNVDAYVKATSDFYGHTTPIGDWVTVEFWRANESPLKIPYALEPDQAVKLGRRLLHLGMRLGGKGDDEQ